ncbi:nuclear transport factor 2 family protein [Pseudoalteromonas sp. OOF1S-7]|uniref:nuclear transport factor 2 family protein n=1 Tax=Pseudoalteromonas sp. OOF1S-7 TaxID=2917757 RepID=UPI001EF4E230|nr:nuclear transport factor 2 family protein [Pseudoalteromonas sp. OOF1S-7]MCG7534550.1 nuclear transport factor 2 family protein [Pseudoalteromonas sp. OOF1S-7]
MKADLSQIQTIVQCYFTGLHSGDSEALRHLFHPDCWLKAPGLRRTRDEWLELVSLRTSPAEQGAEIACQVLAIDLLGQQAMVKVLCPLFEHNYIDFLGLLKEQGQWRIVNKMYADLPHTEQE